MKSSILTWACVASIASLLSGCARHHYRGGTYEYDYSTNPGPAATAGTPREIEQGLVPTEPPPAPPNEPELGTPPGSEYVWVPGHYDWRAGRYVWVSGRWEISPRPHATWVPGHWDRRGRGYVWIPGYWR
jgi:hypothetical protein